MILRIIFIVACLQATILSAQTEDQKKLIFERINQDTKRNVVLRKTEHFTNKEEFFNNAQIIPVYKINLDENNKPKLTLNKNYFLVFYIGRLYVFIDNENSRLFENSPIIQTINKYNSEKKPFKVVYFTENFSLDRKFLNPLITDNECNYIIEKDINYSFSTYVENKYGSINKLKEIINTDSLRENLKTIDYINYVKNDYKSFEYNCPKDTTLILKKLISQIRVSTKNFSDGQEAKLLYRINEKLKPFENIRNQLKKTFKENRSSDSIIKANIDELNLKEDKYKKDRSNTIGLYEYKVYGSSITNELLEVLTDGQFIDFKKYIDIMNPIVETLNPVYNNKYRYNYGKEILEKENTINKNDNKAFKEFKSKILNDCGCPFDETIKREIIIR
ncbi:hypothetical protein [Flavobacterium succinicans]|uniref:Uncharacterized protein n=1 Tax=Flavobacterium succinicans TaxID=29536 RepID=A0A199XTX9_9FLAO|nr:hypothetical protein [Flavobacterium succinicans]OAZ04691.1 hypothetical protein FLB_05380 [Flavobacterium succinicans]